MKPNTRIGILSVKVGEMIPKFLFLGRISEEYFSGSGEVELFELLVGVVVTAHI